MSAPLRVLEIGERLSGAYAGLLLAALGHDVCQWHDGLARDLDEAERAYFDRARTVPGPGAELAPLLALADVVVCDLAPRRLRELGLPTSEDALEAARPGRAQVQATITSFGLDGPHAELEADDITDWAAGGLAYATRRQVPLDQVETYTPVLPAARQPEMLAGLVGALGALTGRLLAQQTGRAVLVDVSRQEVLASTSHHHVPVVLNDHKVPGAPDSRLTAMGWILPARDGDVYLRTVERHQWESLRAWMGEPAWSDAVGELPFYMVDPAAAALLVGEWAREHDRAYLLAEGQRRKIPIALPREPAEVLAWEHPRARGTWEAVALDGRDVEAPRIPLLQGGELGPARRDADGALLSRWTAR